MNIIIEGNNIFKANLYDQKEECIGVITSVYIDQKSKTEQYEKIATEAIEKSEEYLELLYVNGIKERPKTQEDINVELIKKLEAQEAVNKELMQAIISLNSKLNKDGVKDEPKQYDGDSSKNGNGQGKNK